MKGSRKYRDGINAAAHSQTEFAESLRSFCGGTDCADEESLSIGALDQSLASSSCKRCCSMLAAICIRIVFQTLIRGCNGCCAERRLQRLVSEMPEAADMHRLSCLQVFAALFASKASAKASAVAIQFDE